MVLLIADQPPLLNQNLKFDFHQAVVELLLLVLYKSSFQGLSGDNSFHLYGLLIQPDVWATSFWYDLRDGFYI